MGAEAIQKRLEAFDLVAEAASLHDEIANGKGQRKIRAIKRLKVVQLVPHDRPLAGPAMVLDVVPVIPPELRPMVQLDGGPLRDLRPQRPVPPRHQPEQPPPPPARSRRAGDHREQREAGCSRRPSTRCSTTAAAAVPSPARATARSSRSPTCSRASRGASARTSSDKRVDYSGRSVIIAGPAAQAAPVRSAEADGARAVQAVRHQAAHRPRLLAEHQVREAQGRAQRPAGVGTCSRRSSASARCCSTAHRPCTDWASRPSSRSSWRARRSSCTRSSARRSTPTSTATRWPSTCRCPSRRRPRRASSCSRATTSGSPPTAARCALPSQDMIIGLHHLTTVKEGSVGEGRAFTSIAEAILALDQGSLDLNAVVKIRLEDGLRETTLGARDLQRGAAGGLRVLRGSRRQVLDRPDRQRPRRALPAGRGGRDARPGQGRRLQVGDPFRRHGRAQRHRDPAEQAADHRRLREAGGRRSRTSSTRV